MYIIVCENKFKRSYFLKVISKIFMILFFYEKTAFLITNLSCEWLIFIFKFRLKALAYVDRKSELANLL